MKKRGLIIVVLLIASILFMSGCNSTEEESTEITNEELISISHPLGETEVVKNPKKVIVFDYAILDSLDEMEVDIMGLPKSNIPEFLEKFNDEKYENVGTLFEPDFEKIYELDPDVIFISSRQMEVYDELSEIAPTVYLEMDTRDYMGSVTKNVTTLGEIFDKEDLVKSELDAINSEIDNLNKKVTESENNALVVLANDGLISAYGAGSRFGIIHDEFGFVPVDTGIEVSKHGQSITFEYILEKNPEYVFVIDRAATTGGSVSAKQIFDNDLIRETNAYQDDKIIYLSSQIWYVASGGLTGTRAMIEDVESGL